MLSQRGDKLKFSAGGVFFLFLGVAVLFSVSKLLVRVISTSGVLCCAALTLPSAAISCCFQAIPKETNSESEIIPKGIEDAFCLIIPLPESTVPFA